MELLKYNTEEKAFQKLSLSQRKLAVDCLRRYYAILFHPDVTDWPDALLARINAGLDNIEKGIYKASPFDKPKIPSDIERYIHSLNEQEKYRKDQVKQLEMELRKKQEYIDILYSIINQSRKRVKKITLSTFKCLRCGHEWIPNKPVEPKVCPTCKSPIWNKPKWKQSGLKGAR